MAHVNVTAQLPMPPHAVWPVIASPVRYPEWLTMHHGWRGEPPAQIGKGSTFTELCTVMGMTNTIDWTVETYDAPRILKIAGSGLAGAKITLTISLAPHERGSTANIEAEFSGQLVVGAIAMAIERNAKIEVERSLDKLAVVVA